MGALCQRTDLSSKLNQIYVDKRFLDSLIRIMILDLYFSREPHVSDMHFYSYVIGCNSYVLS